jgi:hypothetical protein
MTLPADPPRAQRSLPLSILIGAAATGTFVPVWSWLELLIFHETLPGATGPVWMGFVTVRAVAGLCVGAAVYAADRTPPGWLRWCLYCILMCLIIQGDVTDFVSRSLQRYLLFWVVSSLIYGVIVGTAFHVLQRRNRTAGLRG